MSILVDALRTAMAPKKPRTSTGAVDDATAVNMGLKGFLAGILVGGLGMTAVLIRRGQDNTLLR